MGGCTKEDNPHPLLIVVVGERGLSDGHTTLLCPGILRQPCRMSVSSRVGLENNAQCLSVEKHRPTKGHCVCSNLLGELRIEDSRGFD